MRHLPLHPLRHLSRLLLVAILPAGLLLAAPAPVRAAGEFTDIGAGLPAVWDSAVAWDDYDSDGDLDILLTGYAPAWATIAQVHRNNSRVRNTPPAAPTGLAGVASDDQTVSLSWQGATDDHTPSSGLSYNLRVGTTPGGSDLLAPMAAPDGWRRLPQLGSAQEWITATLDLARVTPGSTVYWSVQALDSAFQGGPFAAEGQIRIGYRELYLPLIMA